jgi:hypothetical protein
MVGAARIGSLSADRSPQIAHHSGGREPYLGQCERDRPLGGAQPARLVAVARAVLTEAAPLVAAASTQELGLLGFEQLLDDELRRSFYKRGDDVRLRIDATLKQSVEVLADVRGWG